MAPVPAMTPVSSARYNLRPRPSTSPTTMNSISTPKRTPVRPSTSKISKTPSPIHKRNETKANSVTQKKALKQSFKFKLKVSTMTPIKTESDITDTFLIPRFRTNPDRYLPGTKIRIIIGSCEKAYALAKYCNNGYDRIQEESYHASHGVVRWVNRQRVIANSSGWECPNSAPEMRI
jgi:hypothetical protein